jgi:hypothetical protein
VVRPAAMVLSLATAGLALLATSTGRADPADNHASDVACAHCHSSPHPDGTSTDCASCHQDADWLPSTFDVARHAQARFPLDGRHADVACGSCHVDHRLTGIPTECAGCHVDRHRGLLGEDCTECHSVNGFKPVASFDHARTGFLVQGGHTDVGCATCHTDANGQALREGRGGACSTCHEPEHGELGACADCHSDAHDAFVDARSFDHARTGFHLERRHGSQPCASCHVKGQPTPLPRCGSCHVDPHMGQLTSACEECHQPDRWRLVRFDHDLSGWALRGRHHVTPCAGCHVNQRWIGTPTECWDCHADDVVAAPRSVPAHAFGRVDCADCHGGWSW